MADEQDSGNEGAEQAALKEKPAEDRLKNLQAETTRKVADLYAELANRDKKLDQIVEMLAQQRAPQQQQSQSKSISDLMIENPDAAVTQIAQQVGEAVEKRVVGQVAAQSEFSQAAAALESEYPEFRDRTSEHYAKVKQYYDSQPAALKGTPAGLENAAFKAARDYGLIPASKRKNAQNEDFLLSPSQSSTRTRSRGKESNEMTQDQAQFAELLGANTKDPKFKEIFAKANNRNYGSYKGED